MSKTTSAVPKNIDPTLLGGDNKAPKAPRPLAAEATVDFGQILQQMDVPPPRQATLPAETATKLSFKDKEAALLSSKRRQEILDKYDLFVGSQATDFGEALTRHDEF